MKAAPIVAQLQGLGIRQFGGLLDWASQRSLPLPGSLPALFVVPEGGSAENRDSVGAIDQRVTPDWMIVLMLDATARKLDGVDDRLDDLEQAVIGRLAGWIHPEAAPGSPMLFNGSRLLSASDGVVTWALRFRSRYHIRKDYR